MGSTDIIDLTIPPFPGQLHEHASAIAAVQDDAYTAEITIY
jgi:hypothetical protein